METIITQFKNLYQYDSWNQKRTNQKTKILQRPYSLHLKDIDPYKRIGRFISPSIQKELYTISEIVTLKASADKQYRIETIPYFNQEDCNEGLLQRIISQTPYIEVIDESKVGEICYRYEDTALIFMKYGVIIHISFHSENKNNTSTEMYRLAQFIEKQIEIF
ncbi:MAG: hypothetical protein RR868_02360 [Muribaculaceae bacterium]